MYERRLGKRLILAALILTVLGAGGCAARSTPAVSFEPAAPGYTALDVQFVNGMIHHHAQALVMAELAPTRGAGPEVQTLAARTLNGQRDEIARMQRWLEDRGQAVPQPATGSAGREAATDHAQHGMAGGAAGSDSMPGMLTADQLAELERARGPEFDRLFLTFMIQHHSGAVRMVDEFLEAGGALQDPELFRTASDIHVDQTTEINRMRRLLDTIGPLQLRF